jgi:hypothetical protein
VDLDVIYPHLKVCMDKVDTDLSWKHTLEGWPWYISLGGVVLLTRDSFPAAEYKIFAKKVAQRALPFWERWASVGSPSNKGKLAECLNSEESQLPTLLSTLDSLRMWPIVVEPIPEYLRLYSIAAVRAALRGSLYETCDYVSRLEGEDSWDSIQKEWAMYVLEATRKTYQT